MSTESTAPSLQSKFAFTLNVTVDQPLIVGDSSHGLRRIIPISGGTFKGPGLEGRIVPGGADWQFVRADGVLCIDARYTLQSDDGVLIMINNRGLRHGTPQVMQQLMRAEPVDAGQYYFRTVAEFEAPTSSRYSWLNRALFIGVAERAPKQITIKVYQIT